MKKFIILFCLLLLLGCQSQTKLQEAGMVQAKLLRVVSGHSLQVVGMGDRPSLISQVRLIGIDAPDLRQRPWGDQAKQHLEALIPQEQLINLEFDLETKDKIGRILAYVWKDGVLLNELLVKQGQALFAARSPNNKYDLRLERAQQWARLVGEGIWNPEKPMRTSPNEFRQQENF